MYLRLRDYLEGLGHLINPIAQQGIHTRGYSEAS
jgi:hypothetical protein